MLSIDPLLIERALTKLQMCSFDSCYDFKNNLKSNFNVFCLIVNFCDYNCLFISLIIIYIFFIHFTFVFSYFGIIALF